MEKTEITPESIEIEKEFQRDLRQVETEEKYRGQIGWGIVTVCVGIVFFVLNYISKDISFFLGGVIFIVSGVIVMIYYFHKYFKEVNAH